MDKHFIYILECSDGSLYTGYTNDLDKRLDTHNAGKGAKYTRMRLPVKRVYEEIFHTKREAMQREYAIKQLTRSQKIKLIQGDTV
ncbi:GIY-YIG nuclease family protein [Macrococcus equi]|uniref:GIY-YIG nuclease family protein n=1 Tax=Macrococcus equi TaxID=3395462 RepID=UPI0039BDF281